MQAHDEINGVWNGVNGEMVGTMDAGPAPHGMDEARSEAFAGRMVDMLNLGGLAILCSIGHRTRLFDIMATLPPATSGQIAEAAELNERYVREWLSAMVVGGVMEYDPESQVFNFPREHAAWLTRDAGAGNLAIFAQHIGSLGQVEDAIIDCFRQGGGVPYSAFDRFHEIMAEDSYVNVVQQLDTTVLPLVPGLMEKLEQGIHVLDLGCGRGKAILHMAKTFPQSTFAGFDASEEAIDFAQREAARQGVTNVRFWVQDATTFDATDEYDLVVTFDAIHDQAHPLRVLRNIANALKPEGVYLMQDIAASTHLHENVEHPLGAFLYTLSTMHCMTVSLASGGEGLGTMWGKEKALELLARAGFGSVEVHQLEHDVCNYYYICTQS